MALIQCSKCGKQYSSHALQCPQCGLPQADIPAFCKQQEEEKKIAEEQRHIRRIKRRTMLKKWFQKICIILGCIAVCLVIAFLIGGRGYAFKKDISGRGYTITGVKFYLSSKIPSKILFTPVTTIERYAFERCQNMTSVTIPNSITTIGCFAFYNCSGLTKTNYTGTIADWCKIEFCFGDANPMYYSHNFYINNVEIKDLVIPEGVDTIGSFAFCHCSGLTSVTIPNSVTTIGYAAFAECTGLTSIEIPSSVTSIGDYAFGNCTGLTSVTIGNSVTTIEESAFWGCSGLTSVTIPNSVTKIGSSAFSGCSGLTSITCHAIVPPSCGCYGCFEKVDTSIPVYVPANSVSKYQVADGWKAFTNIQAIE